MIDEVKTEALLMLIDQLKITIELLMSFQKSLHKVNQTYSIKFGKTLDFRESHIPHLEKAIKKNINELRHQLCEIRGE
jgi:hypothetical protein